MWEVWTSVLSQFTGYIFGFFYGGAWGDDPRRGSIPGRNKWEITLAQFLFLFPEGSLQSISLPNPPPPDFNVGDERHQPKPRGASQQKIFNIKIGGRGLTKTCLLKRSAARQRHQKNVIPLFPFCFCIHVSKTGFPLIPPGDGLRFKGIPFKRSV